MTAHPQLPLDLERAARRNARAIVAEGALFSLIRLGVSPFLVLPFYLEQLTDSKLLIGLIPALYVIGFAVPQFPMARLLQRSRHRLRLLVWSAVGQRLGILGMLVLTIVQVRLPDGLTIGIFFGFYLLFNLSRGCYSPAYIDFLGRAVAGSRGKIIGLGNFIGGLLTLGGTLLLTRLLSDLPYPQAITAVMAIAFGGSALSLVAVLFYRDLTPAAPAASVPPPGERTGLPSPLFRRYLAWRAVIVGLEMMLSFYTLYGLEKFSLPPAYVGIFAAVLTLSDALGNPFWGWLGDRAGYLRVIQLASLLGCLGAVLAVAARGPLAFSLVFLLNGLMLSGQLLAGVNITYEFAPRRELPLYVAFHQVILSVLSGLAPVAGAVLTAAWGYAAGAFAAALAGAAGALGLQLGVRSPRLDLQEQPAEDAPG